MDQAWCACVCVCALRSMEEPSQNKKGLAWAEHRRKENADEELFDGG